MSPREVQGLQNLAQAHGTSLTINPHTGMPEAFSLNSLLPMLGGLALGIVAPAALPWAAGGMGLYDVAKGKNLLQTAGDVSSVLSGGSLASGFGAAGAATTPAAAGAAETAKDVVPAAAGSITPDKVMGLPDGVDATKALNVNMAGTGGNIPIPEGYGAAGTPGTYFDKSTGDMFSTTSGDAGKIFQQSAQPIVPSPASPDLTQALSKEQLASGREAFTAATPSERAAMAQRGLSGWVDPSNKAVGFGTPFQNMGMIDKAGLASTAMDVMKENAKKPEEHKPVYYITDPKTGKPLYSAGTINPNIAKLGYIPAGEQAFTGQGFNEGVYSYSPTEYKPVPGMRSGGLAGLAHYDGGGAVPQSKGQQILATNAPMPTAQQGTNQAALQNMNTMFANQAMTSAYPQMNQPAPSPQANTDWMAHYNQMIGVGAQPTAPSQVTDPLAAAAANYDAEQAAKAAEEEASADPYGNKFDPFGRDRSTQHMATGGLANLGGTYKAGGKLLRGPGDGMSDSIPAVIGGQKPQRAALADGEFVIPADVVSHLGNGSTEAGSRKLYAMMDKIRHARTGRKKQAPAVKAERYMPA
jgi:hypothetical protein